METKITIGTRASRLAMAQAQWIAGRIRECYPGVEIQMKEITTHGDSVRDLPLDKMQQQGVFTRAIEAALLDGSVDIAVHSMKDLPSEMDERLVLACVPRREDPHDALVLRGGARGLDDLPHGAKIGSGSKRRAFQLLRLRDDLAIGPIRGNIETRLEKMETEQLDGIILAAAGLNRLGLQDRITRLMPVEQMVPACGQGALAVQCRKENDGLCRMLQPVCDARAMDETTAERAYLRAVNGGCHLPVGANCRIENGVATMAGLFGHEDGSRMVAHTITALAGEPMGLLGERLAKEIMGRLRDERE